MNNKNKTTGYMSVSEIIKKLNQNYFFKFASSIRLAVPLMLILGAIVAYGTVVESNYNAEYAAMAIYKTPWFGALLIALWINIFLATVSRIPFKLHHTGFVITHLGLLTLLIGGYITNSDGIDGQFVIPENQSSSTVTLPHLMIGYQFEGSVTPQIIKFKKTISPQSQNDLKNINENTSHLFIVKKYIPFAKIEKQYAESTNPADQSVALSFILKSNFFNVSEWLNSDANPEMKLGPATLKIIKTDDLNKPYNLVKVSKIKKTAPKKQNPHVASKTLKKNDSTLVLTNLKNPNDIKKIKISELSTKAQNYQGLQIKLIKAYRHAVVSANKVVESDDSEISNPALELSIEKEGQKLREILYAKFSGFSLNKNGVFGYKLSYENTEASESSTPQNEETPSPSAIEEQNLSPAQMAMKGGNTVIFSVDPKEKNKARVTLIKNNEVVMSEIISEGQNIQTPWMGMKIFLGSVVTHAIEQISTQPINAEKAPQLPPSALLISTADNINDEFWLAEGEQKQLQLAGKNAVIYFGRQTVELPFDLKLEKFSKVDYPGTSTPMSFESLVQIGKTGVVQKISMNEPLKIEGYTIYQASYSMNPGQTLSIFSVNQDPGRALKYIGSLILGLGIIIITLMKSRIWKAYIQGKNKNV